MWSLHSRKTIIRQLSLATTKKVYFSWKKKSNFKRIYYEAWSLLRFATNINMNPPSSHIYLDLFFTWLSIRFMPRRRSGNCLVKLVSLLLCGCCSARRNNFTISFKLYNVHFYLLHKSFFTPFKERFNKNAKSWIFEKEPC